MGTYFILANVTRRVQFTPGNIKASGFRSASESIVELLLTSWLGDEVRLLSDNSGDDDEVQSLYTKAEGWPNVWEKKGAE